MPGKSLVFIDSLQFMNSSLNELDGNLHLYTLLKISKLKKD